MCVRQAGRNNGEESGKCEKARYTGTREKTILHEIAPGKRTFAIFDPI
jgi:hypothetical protein